MVDNISLHTLENLISENLVGQTSVTTLAPDDEPRTWYEPFEEIYDKENCMYEKTILADHRNYIRLIRPEMLFRENKLPLEIDCDVLWLKRNVISPLRE